jgi:hypothetical protein
VRSGDRWVDFAPVPYGLFLLRGIGPVLIAGAQIDASAVISVGLMTAGVAVTHLTIVLHRLGIPEEILGILDQAVMDGKTVMLMHCGPRRPRNLAPMHGVVLYESGIYHAKKYRGHLSIHNSRLH